MLLEDGSKTEAIDVMQYVWTGEWPENRAPQVHGFTLDEKTAHDSVTLEAGASLRYEGGREVAILDARHQAAGSLRLPQGSFLIAPGPHTISLEADLVPADEAKARLPDNVTPTLGPDATGVGWALEYALIDHSEKHSLADLRTFQDWYLRYWLKAVPGVTEASVNLATERATIKGTAEAAALVAAVLLGQGGDALARTLHRLQPTSLIHNWSVLGSKFIR